LKTCGGGVRSVYAPYIVVNCKTGGCAVVHVLTYLGEKGKTAESKVNYIKSFGLGGGYVWG